MNSLYGMNELVARVDDIRANWNWYKSDSSSSRWFREDESGREYVLLTTSPRSDKIIAEVDGGSFGGLIGFRVYR